MPKEEEDEVIQKLPPGLAKVFGMGVSIFEAALDQ